MNKDGMERVDEANAKTSINPAIKQFALGLTEMMTPLIDICKKGYKRDKEMTIMMMSTTFASLVTEICVDMDEAVQMWKKVNIEVTKMMERLDSRINKL